MRVVDGVSVYIENAIASFANAKIILVTGGPGTKLILLGSIARR
ncbi:MAG: hypothetical protein P4M01_00005 [Acidobacteriota bacterium]|nr:hypothetical protein [Acidobacteriota bacterium]